MSGLQESNITDLIIPTPIEQAKAMALLQKKRQANAEKDVDARELADKAKEYIKKDNE